MGCKADRWPTSYPPGSQAKRPEAAFPPSPASLPLLPPVSAASEVIFHGPRTPPSHSTLESAFWSRLMISLSPFGFRTSGSRIFLKWSLPYP